jgi:DNA-binding transcriptional LysR family regulator
MIRLDGLAAFLAIVEGGSISEAARRLRLSKSVVSERLVELERSLGGALLHRTTRKLSLTEDGAAFLERARRIAYEIDLAATDMAERRGTLSGPLRIAAPVTFGRLHLGPALYPFLLTHPAIELVLDLDDRRIDMASSGHDAIIRNGPILDSRLIVWKLAESPRLMVASPAYLAKYGRPHSLADLNQHRGVFYSNRGAADWRFNTKAGPEMVRAHPALIVNNGDMMRDAVVAGLGLALLPAFIARPAIKTGQLEEIILTVQPEPEFLYMAHAQGREPSAKLRALADHLRKAFGSPPYWD